MILSYFSVFNRNSWGGQQFPESTQILVTDRCGCTHDIRLERIDEKIHEEGKNPAPQLN